MTTIETIANDVGLPCDADLLLDQIGRWTLARCGARDIVDLHDGIMFRVSGVRRKVIVKLNLLDLFDVEVGRLTGRHGLDGWKVLAHADDVDVSVLSEVVERLCGERS